MLFDALVRRASCSKHSRQIGVNGACCARTPNFLPGTRARPALLPLLHPILPDLLHFPSRSHSPTHTHIHAPIVTCARSGSSKLVVSKGHDSVSWLESTSRVRGRNRVCFLETMPKHATEHPHKSAARAREAPSIDEGNQVRSELQINQLCDLEPRVSDLKFSAGRDVPERLYTTVCRARWILNRPENQVCSHEVTTSGSERLQDLVVQHQRAFH